MPTGPVYLARTMKHAMRIVVATLLMILCAVTSVFLPASGRDFRPQLLMMGILILLLALVLRAWRRWLVIEFLGALACVEFFTLYMIGYFSGFQGLALFESFNLNWWRGLSEFIAVPW